MAAPVIVSEQSVLEVLQWSAFSFIPYATNSPTRWNCSPLPEGWDFDTSTGKVSTESAVVPGVCDFALTAINEDGASTPLTFTLGIEATAAIQPTDAVDLTVDLGTGEVSSPFPSPRQVSRGDGAAKRSVSVLAWLKYGDVRLFHVRFLKNGIVWDGDLASLAMTLKNYEDESVLVTTSTFARAATGSGTFYRLAVTVTGSGLKGEIEGLDDDGSGIAAIAELEWTWSNVLTPTVGPETLRTSTPNFFLGLAPELTPNS